jgi:hypothetical protein
MPVHAGARRDAIDVALRTLDDESRRFARLGFARPLERCREARRFWSFVLALHAMAPETNDVAGRIAKGSGSPS